MNIQIFKPLLKNNEKKHIGLHSTANGLAKDHLSPCNRPSFASYFTAYWQALDFQTLAGHIKTQKRHAGNQFKLSRHAQTIKAKTKVAHDKKQR